jgi:hypothetical protein
MWNDPYYNDLYEEIVALDPPPEVEGSLQDLLSVDPDGLLLELEERTEKANIKPIAAIVVNEKNVTEKNDATLTMLNSIKASLRSGATASGGGNSLTTALDGLTGKMSLSDHPLPASTLPKYEGTPQSN